MELSFSEREGKKQLKAIQLNSMDFDLKNQLWSAFYLFIIERIKYSRDHSRAIQDTNLYYFFRFCWIDFLKQPLDEIPPSVDKNINALRGIFYCEWFTVYDFLEYVIKQDLPKLINKQGFIVYCNEILEKENSAYRILNSAIVPLTNKEEISEVTTALEKTDHLKKALVMLSSRESPDYENSIKESISAVEAICKHYSHKKDFNSALKFLENKESIGIHPALCLAFHNLFGWASDEQGVRHGSITKSTNCSLAEARFMLVSCSAFVNYLSLKMENLKFEK